MDPAGMIEFVRGDILMAGAEALVNTVNCDGFMGRGIALQFRRVFPDNFEAYEAACKRGELRPGLMLVVATSMLANPKFIINFPTKKHWRGKSRLSFIDDGLAALVAEVRNRGIRSIAVPPLGCGLGGLAWSEVRPRIVRAFSELPDVKVTVFEPAGAPAADRMARPAEAPDITPWSGSDLPGLPPGTIPVPPPAPPCRSPPAPGPPPPPPGPRGPPAGTRDSPR